MSAKIIKMNSYVMTMVYKLDSLIYKIGDKIF